MKSEESDLIDAAIRRATEEGRRRLGRPPSREELVAFRRGELSPEDRDMVEERLAHHPDAVRELLTIPTSAEAGAAGEAESLSEEDVKREWVLLQARLGALREPPQPVQPEPRRVSMRWTLAMAASLLVGLVGVGWGTWVWLNSNAPKTGIQDLRLLPDAPLRGPAAAPRVRLEPTFDHFLIQLKPPDTAADFPGYRLEISRADSDAPVWSADPIARGPGGAFFLWLPRSYLDGGAYRFRLYGLEGGVRTHLADYSFVVP